MAAALTVGCTGSGGGNKSTPQPADTVYTQQAAMDIYAYQPLRALQIIDSALIVGNVSEVWRDVNRARIFGQSLMGEQLDSLLGGPEGVRLDTARAIGERLLQHDSVKAGPALRQNVLEILVYTARRQQDTLRWVQRSRELVDVCRKAGEETEALRTEAELAAALYYAGQQAESLAKIDSVIEALQALPSPPKGRDVGLHNATSSHQTSPPSEGLGEAFTFNELDALILASKRKIGVLNSMGRFAETLLVARRILDLLDDYERHPDRYHDGSSREPKDDTSRDDYIRFYRSQAQNFITATYAALGSRGSMEETFYEVERTVRDATAREHQARYQALQRQMEAERQQARADRSRLLAAGISALLLLAVCFALYYWRQKRIVTAKNRVLVRLIDETMAFREQASAQPLAPATSVSPQEEPGELEEEPALFDQLRHIIEGERLYLDPTFDRQTLIDRYGLTKERIGAAFAKGSGHASLSAYVNTLRMDYAYRLLLDEPDLPLDEVAARCGFSSRSYFGHRFKLQFGMTPTEFRLSHQ